MNESDKLTLDELLEWIETLGLRAFLHEDGFVLVPTDPADAGKVEDWLPPSLNDEVARRSAEILNHLESVRAREVLEEVRALGCGVYLDEDLLLFDLSGLRPDPRVEQKVLGMCHDHEEAITSYLKAHPDESDPPPVAATSSEGEHELIPWHQVVEAAKKLRREQLEKRQSKVPKDEPEVIN